MPPSRSSAPILVSLIFGAAALYYLCTSTTYNVTTYVPSSLSWYPGTMTTTTSPKGWYERTAPHPAPEEWTPRREALSLAILHSTKSEPEGFTLALFSDTMDSGQHVAVDAMGRVVLVPGADHEAMMAHAQTAMALPETGMFRNLWQVKQPTTSQPIDRVVVPRGTAEGENAEVSVSGWVGSSEDAMPLKRPVEGIEELPSALKELIGLALEARQDFDSGSMDQAMVSRVKNCL